MLRLKPLVALVACLLYAACTDGTGLGDSEADYRLNDTPISILRRSITAPKLETYEASFRACRNERQTLRIAYQGDSGSGREGGEGTEFVRLEVPSGALLRWPDGRRFAEAECVWITVTADPSLLLAEFEPAGLTFDPARPARLTMYYHMADPDLDDDGSVVDDDDEIEEESLGLWRLPHGGEPWHQIDARHDEDAERFDADLQQFSHYAVAH